MRVALLVELGVFALLACSKTEPPQPRNAPPVARVDRHFNSDLYDLD